MSVLVTSDIATMTRSALCKQLDHAELRVGYHPHVKDMMSLGLVAPWRWMLALLAWSSTKTTLPHMSAGLPDKKLALVHVRTGGGASHAPGQPSECRAFPLQVESASWRDHGTSRTAACRSCQC